jgi:hypothetical protein
MVNNEMISRIKVEGVRKVFPKETSNFTVWLEDHIEALAERVGIELTDKRGQVFTIDKLQSQPYCPF